LLKKAIELFSEIAENKEDFNKFYEGLQQEPKVMKFMMIPPTEINLWSSCVFYSSKSGSEMTSLKDYITRMKEGQEFIY